MADSTYQPKTYRKDGGDTHVIASGGELRVESYGIITKDGTQASHIADAITNYTTNNLSTEASIIAAFNTANGKINSILSALEGVGILKTS